MSSTTKKFATGATILAVAGILAKCLSLFFRIPLASDVMLGDEGMGYYQLPYPYYSLLIAVSYLGIPSAMSKMVSEKVSIGKYKEAHQIFKHSLVILSALGVVASFILFMVSTGSKWPKESVYAFYGLALAPFFVSIMGAFRGYFQGMQNMAPTAISQLLESFTRVIVGVGLAAVLLKHGLGYAAGGASFGATAGAIIGMIYLILTYFKNRSEILENVNKDKKGADVPLSKVLKMLFMVALPITLGAAINSLISIIDSSVIIPRLMDALLMTEKEATSLFGILSGKATTLINVPLTISMAIVLSMMPAVSEAVARDDKEELDDKIELGIRFALFLALPSATGLAILADPIMKLLYGENTGGGFTLTILSFSLIFIILGQLFAAILQGMGKLMIPIKNLSIAAIFKLVLTYLLVGIPSLNVNGAAIATVITYLMYSVLNYVSVKKYTNFKIKDKAKIIYKPIFATILMAVLTLMAYYAVSSINISFRIVTIFAVGVGGVTYLVSLILTKAIGDEDLDMIPQGDKIKKIVDKITKKTA